MNKPERKRTTSTRRDYYKIILLLTMIAAFVFRIPLGRLIGDNGIAYFSAANEIYLAVAGAISYGLSEAAAILVRYRVRRQQPKSAEKVLSGALLLGGAAGMLITLLLIFLGTPLMDGVFHMPLAQMAVSLMAPAILFSVLTGAFRGYFQGNGSKVPAMHSQILQVIFLFAGGMIGGAVLHGYGLKVSAFLQNEDYAGAYGAMGASIGLLLASVLCFLHVLALFFIYRNSARKQMGREQQRNQDTRLQVFRMLIGTGALYALYWFCFQGMPLLDQYLFFSMTASSQDKIVQWGQYYGRCMVIIGIVSCLIHLLCLMPVRRIMTSLERQENRIANEKLGILIHQCAVITVPTAVLLAVLAENILDLLFLENQKQTVQVLQIGSITVVFYVFAAVFMEMLLKGRKMKYVTGMGAIAFLLHGLTAVLLLTTVKMGITGIAVSVVLFYGAVAVMGFLLISRTFQYRQEWIKSFAVTLIAAAVSGVAAMLLNRVFVPLLGTAVSMVICILVSVILYILLLLVMRAFQEEELEEMSGGRALLMLARLLHLL